MTSQLVIFRAFLFIFFRPPDPRSEKKIPINQLLKTIWPYQDTMFFPFLHTPPVN